MAESEQDQNDRDPEEVVGPQDEGAMVLDAILRPINENMARQNRILEHIMQRLDKVEETKEEPPNWIKQAMPMLESVGKALIQAFTAPETPAEAMKQGLFDDDLMAGFKKQMMDGWNFDQQRRALELQKLQADVTRANRLADREW